MVVVSADYQLREDQTLMQALQPHCAQMAKRVMDLGTLRRISLQLRGQAYDRAGQTAAHWRGQVVELHADTRLLV